MISGMVSIIIPVYNAQSTLKRAVISALAQTYANTEILIIDDGSVDDSLNCARELEQQHGPVRVLSQENRGVSAARNTGIENAQGEYIAFLDADDVLRPDFCAAMVNCMQPDINLVLCGFECVRETDVTLVIPKNWAAYQSAMSIVEDFEAMFFDAILNTPWNKLYRKSSIQTCFYEGKNSGEDLEFVLNLMAAQKEIGICPQYLYIQHVDAGSLSHNNTAVVKWMEDNHLKLQHFLEENHICYNPETFSDYFLSQVWLSLGRAQSAGTWHINDVSAFFGPIYRKTLKSLQPTKIANKVFQIALKTDNAHLIYYSISLIYQTKRIVKKDHV